MRTIDENKLAIRDCMADVIIHCSEKELCEFLRWLQSEVERNKVGLDEY